MAARRARKRHKRGWWKWAAAAVLLAFLLLGVAISIVLHRAEPMLRAAIVEKLEEHFHAHVELDSFHVSLIDGLWAKGKGLRIWPPANVVGVAVPGPNGAVETKPLIRLDEFRFHAPLRYKPGEPIRIAVVELIGLDVDVPPKPHFTHVAAPAGGVTPDQDHEPMLRFEIESMECKGAHLTLETSKPGKLPLEFAIAHIKLSHVSVGGSMQFDAQLTNPRPAGIIVTSGSMGPWVVEDPGETPLEGNYRFEHADLSVFKGIAGTLNSTGKYQGALRNLTVDGRTDVPDFRLTHFGTSVPLETEFHATVDGTNGDTWLQPVHAKLGESRFTAGGKIVGVPAEALPNGAARPGGHEIALNVNVDRGRAEDFLRLTSKNGTPFLTGALTLKTTLEIPPGTEPVQEKMKLNGSFVLEDAAFTSAKFQNEVGELSRRGQGQPKDAKNAGSQVRSAIASDLMMDNGVITLPNLKYTVPGAEIDLAGKYGLEGGTLNFKGTARTDATVSQMVGGWKGVLLKPADRLFRKNGAGTLVPIHIDGTEQDPRFGIDLGRIGHTAPQIPGQTQ
ncbi:MAG: AsmA-like C-terminal region-containing protein [Terracidiphilus sp.]